MWIGTEDRLMRKRSTSQGCFKLVVAFEKVHQAVKEFHAAAGHGDEKKKIAEEKNNLVKYYSGMLQSVDQLPY